MDVAFYLNDFGEKRGPEKYGFLNSKGEIILNPKYSKAFQYTNGIASILKDSVYGYIDLDGNEKLFSKFKKAFWNGKIGIAINDKKMYALIDLEGNLITDYNYNSIEQTSNDYFYVTQNKTSNFINLKGEKIFDTKFLITNQGVFNSVAKYKSVTELKYGLLGLGNKIITEPIYDEMYGNLYTNYWLVKKDSKYGIINSSGIVVIPLIYDKIKHLVKNENLIPVKLNDYFGYVNEKNDLIIPNIYDSALPFIEGFAIVRKDNQYAYINEKNEKIATFGNEPFWDGQDYFNDGLAFFKINGKMGFINKKGKKVIPAIYDEVGNFTNGLARVKLNDKFGFIDKKGKVIIPIKYTFLSEMTEGRIVFLEN